MEFKHCLDCPLTFWQLLGQAGIVVIIGVLLRMMVRDEGGDRLAQQYVCARTSRAMKLSRRILHGAIAPPSPLGEREESRLVASMLSQDFILG